MTTNLPYEGATADQLAHPMVSHFLEIHGMFRNQLALIVEFVDQLQGSNQPLDSTQTAIRIRDLIRAGQQYTYMLHTHHHIETDSLFPTMKANGVNAEIVDRLNREHDEISLLIDQFSAAIRSAASIDPAILSTDLRKLSDALHAHLAYEETHVCPFLARG